MQTDYFLYTAWAGVAGIFLALIAWGCATAYAVHPEDTRLFHVPIALIGMAGYAAIAGSAVFTHHHPNTATAIINHVLVGITVICTVFLIHRAVKLELFCMGCALCWMFNAWMFIRMLCYLTLKPKVL